VLPGFYRVSSIKSQQNQHTQTHRRNNHQNKKPTEKKTKHDQKEKGAVQVRLICIHWFQLAYKKISRSSSTNLHTLVPTCLKEDQNIVKITPAKPSIKIGGNRDAS